MYVNQTSVKWFLKERNAKCWPLHQNCYIRTEEVRPSRPCVMLMPAHSGKGRLCTLASSLLEMQNLRPQPGPTEWESSYLWDAHENLKSFALGSLPWSLSNLNTRNLSFSALRRNAITGPYFIIWNRCTEDLSVPVGNNVCCPLPLPWLKIHPVNFLKSLEQARVLFKKSRKYETHSTQVARTLRFLLQF